MVSFRGGVGVPTVKHISNRRDNGNERAPPDLHAAELAEPHVEAVGPSLDFDERLFFLECQPRRKGLALALMLGLIGSGRETGSWNGFEVGVIIAALVVGGVFT